MIILYSLWTERPEVNMEVGFSWAQLALSEFGLPLEFFSSRGSKGPVIHFRIIDNIETLRNSIHTIPPEDRQGGITDFYARMPVAKGTTGFECSASSQMYRINVTASPFKKRNKNALSNMDRLWTFLKKLCEVDGVDELTNHTALADGLFVGLPHRLYRPLSLRPERKDSTWLRENRDMAVRMWKTVQERVPKEVLLSQVPEYEGLSESGKLAIRLCDAYDERKGRLDPIFRAVTSEVDAYLRDHGIDTFWYNDLP